MSSTASDPSVQERSVPETTEAKILFDADKLDSIGAVGIGRAFLFAGEVGARLHNKDRDLSPTKPYTKEDTAYREYMVKLRHSREKMLTKEGRRIAEDGMNPWSPSSAGWTRKPSGRL